MVPVTHWPGEGTSCAKVNAKSEAFQNESIAKGVESRNATNTGAFYAKWIKGDSARLSKSDRSSLAPIVFLDSLSDVFVAGIDLENQLELFEGFSFIAS